MATALCGESSIFSSALRQPGRLVDSGRQNHDRALVENDLQLETQIADRGQNSGLVRLPRRDNDATHGDRDRRRAGGEC